MKRIVMAAMAIIALTTSTGCTTITGFVSLAATRANGLQQNLVARQEDRMKNMEAEMATRMKQRELDWQKRQLEIEQCQTSNRPEIEQVVTTKLDMSLNQTLTVGKLEVDMDALLALIRQREADAALLQQEIGKMDAHSEAQYQTALRAWASECLAAKEMGCCGPKDDDLPAPPVRPSNGIAARILPTEIPYKMSVRMSTDIDGPWITESNVRHLPADDGCCCEGCGASDCDNSCDSCDAKSCPVGGPGCEFRAAPYSPVYFDDYEPSHATHQHTAPQGSPSESPSDETPVPAAPTPPPMPAAEAA
jgi:hypothetical protein